MNTVRLNVGDRSEERRNRFLYDLENKYKNVKSQFSEEYVATLLTGADPASATPQRSTKELFRTFFGCARVGATPRGARLIEAVLEDGVDVAVGAGRDTARPGAGRFQPARAVAFGQAQDTQTRAIALLGMRPVGEDGLDERGGLGADRLGPADDARGRPFQMALACSDNGGAVGNNSCKGDEACSSNSGTIGNNACVGIAACRNNSGNIGSGQCIGDHVCEENAANKP